MRSLKNVIFYVFVTMIAILFLSGCEPLCGDGLCEPEEEGRCVRDCAVCGDGYCERGEFCEQDCEINPVCGNGLCESGESVINCRTDCSNTVCGDGYCESGENERNCPTDCPPAGYCGDNFCSYNEDAYICHEDCGRCGDSICTGNENAVSCPSDCPVTCGDGICQTGEEIHCTEDCGRCSGALPVDCYDGTGCWSAGTNCFNSVFSCGPNLVRCAFSFDYANCCNGIFYTCPASHPFFCPLDSQCYIESAYPAGCNANCNTLGWPCAP